MNHILPSAILALACAATAQSGRSLTQIGLPIVGQTLQIDLSYPASAVGNLFAFAYSIAPFPGSMPITVPGWTVNGELRIDWLSAIIGNNGLLPAGNLVSDALSIPVQPTLLGFAFEVQTYDLNLPTATASFSDNDLEIVLQGIPQWYPEQVLAQNVYPVLHAACNRTGQAVVGYFNLSMTTKFIQRYSPASGWGAPIPTPWSSPFFDDIGIDSYGNVMCVYRNASQDGIGATMHIPGIGWSSEHGLGSSGGSVGVPDLAMSPGGRSIVVYEEGTVFGANIWGAAAYGTAWPPATHLLSYHPGASGQPRVVIDDGNVGSVVFVEAVPNGVGGYNHSLMGCQYVYGTNLATTIALLPGPITDLRVVRSAGRIHAVWNLQTSVYAWTLGGTPTFIGTSASTPYSTIATNGAGQGEVMWVQESGGTRHLWSAALVGTGFGTAQLVDPNASWYLKPQVVVDSAGIATATWLQTGGAFWSRKAPGASWLPSANLDAISTQISAPELVVDAQGDVQALWTRVGSTLTRELVTRSWR